MNTAAQTEQIDTVIRTAEVASDPPAERVCKEVKSDGYARDGFVVDDQYASEHEVASGADSDSDSDNENASEQGRSSCEEDSDGDESGAEECDDDQSDPGALEDTDDEDDDLSGVVSDTAVMSAIARAEKLLTECTSTGCLDADGLHLTCQHGADLPVAEGKVAVACQLRIWRLLANEVERTPHTELLRARIFAGLPNRLRFRAAVNHPLGVLTIFASAGTNEAEITTTFARIVLETGGFTWFLENYEGKDIRVFRLLAAHDRVTDLSLTAVINGAVLHRDEALLLSALARAGANTHLRLTMPLVVLWELYANCWLAPLAAADRVLPFASALDAMENTGGFVRRILANGCSCRGALNDLLIERLPSKQRQGMQPPRGVCSFCKACDIREIDSDASSTSRAARRKRIASSIPGTGDSKGGAQKAARLERKQEI